MAARRRPHQERATLSDVARAAGVSPITVSRTLRNPEIVSPQLREKILGVIEEMGYVPDVAARALASAERTVIAVLVPTMTNYVFTSVMRGIEDRVRSTNLRIQYANSHFDPEEEARQLKLFLGQRPAGIIIATVEGDDSACELLKRAGCPVVQIVELTQPSIDMAIGTSFFDAASDATRHLVECGYRRIGLVGLNMGVRGERRLGGYRAALEDNGLFDPNLIVAGNDRPNVPAGAAMFRTLLEQAPDVDAVLCQTDDVALGALFECQRRGLRVPEDIGICGFNDLDFSSECVPPLTTVRLPRYEIGFKAADMVIGAEKGLRPPQPIVNLGFELVVRGSTAKRPA